MKSFNDLSLQVKFSIITALSLSVVFAVLITAIYYSQKSHIIKESDERFFSHLADLVSLLDEQRRGQEEKVQLSLAVAEKLIEGKGQIIETDSLVEVPYIDNAGQKKVTKLKEWLLGGKILQGDTVLTDDFQRITGSALSIRQFSIIGYLPISTSKRYVYDRERNSNATNQKALLDAINANMFYLGSYIGGSPQTIITVASKNLSTSKGSKAVLLAFNTSQENNGIQQSIREKKYLESGLAYVVSRSGTIIFHPNPKAVGIDLRKSSALFYSEMTNKMEGSHKSFYLDQSNTAKYQYFTYYAPLDVFVSIVVPEKDLLNKPLDTLKILLILGAIIAIIICNILLGIAAIFYSAKPIRQVLDRLTRLAQGKPLATGEVKQKDDYGQILSTINQLTTRLNDASHFAKEVGKGNFGTHYAALDKEDELGKALLEMRDDLKEASEKEAQRQWINEGIGKFNEIIRLNTNQIHELTFQVLAALIKYVNANQGAIFLVDTDDSKAPCLEMSACYAYKRRKYAKKRIYLGDGLVGQTWQEGEEIYLKKVPEEYAKIGSGLGEAPPNCLFIVPLKFNEEIQGVLEIASFQQLTPIEKEFILKIIESLSAAVSVARFSENTKKLLQESQYMMENLRSQEEEMRQNYEELQATQEELSRREHEARDEKEVLLSKIKHWKKSKIDQ
jgi:methyl-accepting chemotaxis protein